MKDRGPGFSMVFDDVARDFGLVGAAVFGCVWRHEHMSHGYCHASIDTMATLLGVNESTIRRQLLRLRAAKMIERTEDATPVEPPHYVTTYVPEIKRKA